MKIENILGLCERAIQWCVDTSHPLYRAAWQHRDSAYQPLCFN